MIHRLLYAMFRFGAFFMERSVEWRVRYENRLQRKAGNQYLADMKRIRVKLEDEPI